MLLFHFGILSQLCNSNFDISGIGVVLIAHKDVVILLNWNRIFFSTFTVEMVWLNCFVISERLKA